MPGIGEITVGADLAGLLLAALAAAGQALADGDVVVVSSKVVSKAEGRLRADTGRDAAVDDETVRVVAERLTPRGTGRDRASRASGPVLAAAGVDASNVAPGTVLVLPADPDASARRACAAALAPAPAGGSASSSPTPWAAPGGRGRRTPRSAPPASGSSTTCAAATDAYGNPLEVTVRAVVDEMAALADLVKGKLGGIPAAVLRGLPDLVTDEDGPGAAALLRPGDAGLVPVRACRGGPDGPGCSPGDGQGAARGRSNPERQGQRLRRAVAVALAAAGRPGVRRGRRRGRRRRRTTPTRPTVTDTDPTPTMPPPALTSRSHPRVGPGRRSG